MVPQYQFNVGYDPLLDPNNISDFNTYRQQLFDKSIVLDTKDIEEFKNSFK